MKAIRNTVFLICAGALALTSWDARATTAVIPTMDPDFQVSVSPDPIESGQPVTVSVTGGKPDAKTFLVYSVNDLYLCAIYVAELKVNVNMCTSKLVPQVQKTDAFGNATWTTTAPVVAASQRIRLQALQYMHSSSVTDVTIEP
ncbi:MAG: hypothetical protein HQ519_08835 [Planctomycetes bacterium]|nr:hypothetical protein [Planctomycetota bacterium]